MLTRWLKGLSKDEAKEMKSLFISGLRLRMRLKNIVDEKITLAATNNLSKSNYDGPNWAFTQADLVGYTRALQEIKSLLDDKQTKE